MNPAWLSLAALFLAVLLSCTSRINVGVLSMALAWLIGTTVARLSVAEIASGFPAQLFLTLTGVTLLFTQAQRNGTLDLITLRTLRLCRGNAGLIPVLFFVVSLLLATCGPGNIATAALVAPVAMSVAGRSKIPAFLMALMVGNGANAGSLSPLAPTGVIVTGLMARIGLGGMEWRTWWYNAAAHAMVAFAGYLLFGGWRLFRARFDEAGRMAEPLQRKHWLTLAVIAGLLAGVMVGNWNVGMAALAGAALLALTGAADENDAVREAPWGVILMVCGVTVLVALLERTQGIDLFSALLAKLATRDSVAGVIAFITGLISAYSSTSGVVLPAFLPAVPGLAARLGADPAAIASAMNVGSHLVDVSPLSTIGALCMAAAAPGEDVRALFHRLLGWGLSMSVAGAVGCWFFFG